MPLPSWVYEQTLRNQRQPLAQPRIPPLPQVGMPGVAIGPGNNPGIPSRGFVGTPQSQVPYGTPVNQGMQPGNGTNTNLGMVGLLPPGHAGSNVPALQMPTYQPPSFVEPQYEDYPTIQNPSTGGLDNQYAQLMAQLQGRMNQPGVQFNSFIPKEQTYSESPELTNAIQMIKSLAESGGYSEQDKNDIRARGVSPIRSVYANAMQDIDRNKALQGGYSPNHNASIAKLTREVADKIAGQTTNVNADLAEKVAQGKLAMAPQLGNITTHMNDLINQISDQNTATANQAGMFNSTGQFNADTTNQGNQNQLMGMIQQLFGQNADISSRNADRAVNVAGMNQRNTENRNQNAANTANSRNQFNMQNSELTQQMQQFMQRLGLDTAQLNQQGRNADNSNSFNWAQLGQQGNRANQDNTLDWARLNQQGGLGLIQAIMQMMGQQGRA